MINSTIWNNTVTNNIDASDKQYDQVSLYVNATVWDSNLSTFTDHDLVVVAEGYDTIRIFADSYGVEGSEFTNVDHNMCLKLDLEGSDIPTVNGDVNKELEIAYAIMDKAQEDIFELLIEMKFEDEVSQFEDY